MPLVRINADKILDWNSFHSVFADVMGFPNYYGRNMDAWIDCMGSLADPSEGMTRIHASPTDPLVLKMEDGQAMPGEIVTALEECVELVNQRQIDAGRKPLLVLRFDRAT